ncbi:DUF1488 family protein [Arsukibacterium perlucidum]|uniref:DUF1488 family protein n=1 Tax=Arsukibacterium perlucidum TaxID=368811 RepID=UPI0003681370|nr:DUF1488 family protein [Arsukibacterium perlucidum]
MNQQLVFNNDFQFDTVRQAVRFSCLVAGLKVNCFIALPASEEPDQFITSIKADAFDWEDRAEQAIADGAYTKAGEIWL